MVHILQEKYYCIMRLRSGKLARLGTTHNPIRTKRTMSRSMTHYKARSDIYPNSDKKRFKIPDSKVSWKVDYPDYKPDEFTAPVVKKGPIWADPDISDKNPRKPIKFNQKDGLVNRISFEGSYELVDNKPINPRGRTGLTGRGLLGKWGPNHAADPIVTRWRRDKNGDVLKDENTGRPILQFVAVLRKDNGEWAIPGGMVDAGEKVSLTLKREFGEEALNSLKYSEKDKKALEKSFSNLFSKGHEIYSGYVDDPRNTDNAWMETTAVNFHDKDGTSFAKMPLEGGDDARSARWMDVSSSLKLYASHSSFLKSTAEYHKAHW
ncbi:ADP-ribose pyrophosphatase, mitochondrial-like isoform X2 [Styela clava]